MNDADLLVRGRAAFESGAWPQAYAHLCGADQHVRVGPDDLERLAVAAHMVGEDEVRTRAWERAYAEWLVGGEPARAARCAFWLSHLLTLAGESARGGGWLARAQRLLDERQLQGAERGLVLMWTAKLRLVSGDPSGALDLLARAGRLASGSGDPDLLAFTWLVHGQALIRLGEAEAGVRLLDEAMLEVAGGRVSPIATGIAYCAVILTCREVFDLARATEWTSALHEWCASQPDLVPFRGQCLVHRSEVMQRHGRWSDAMAEAEHACTHLAERSRDPVQGIVLYQKGELHRLRGDFAEAEVAFRRATECGHDPQPGLALLRVAQGRSEAAAAMMRRVVDEAGDRVARSMVLAAFVEIMIAVADLEAARAAADELSAMAAELDAPLLTAMAARASGCMRLANHEYGAGAAALRTASGVWRELDAPYEDARTRELIALAYRELGDDETARSELAAAGRVFRELGAAPDLERVEAVMDAAPSVPGGLTARELDVLRLVATGATNRDVANQLVISDKTVERHLSNIFAKLGIPNRAAATAYAYEHRLV